MQNTNSIDSTPVFPHDFLSAASDPVAIRMSNDYLFRALLQRNNYVLKGLICSLLHLAEEEVESVEITNPIKLGDSIDEKTFYLDVSIILNNNTLVDLEMQVVNYHDWPERSLVYLCRIFDSIKRGGKYWEIKPAIHISFLDFTLFPQVPEFFATYQLLNIKNHSLYSDKLRLSVVDLTRIDLATEEDKLYHTDKWAALFKATTWEEIKMLAQNNDYIREASNTVYQLSHEEEIRLQCEAREDFYRLQLSKDFEVEQAVAERNSAVAERDSAFAERDSAFAERDSAFAERDSAVAERDSAVALRDSAFAERDSVIIEKNSIIAQLLEENERLRKAQTAT